MRCHLYSCRVRKSLFIIPLIGSLAACQTNSIWEPGPQFGSTINEAVQAQMVNPSAPIANPKVTSGLDGVSAKNSIDNYQKSFEVKPASVGVYPTGAAYGVTPGAQR